MSLNSPKLDKYGFLAGEPAKDMMGDGDAWRTPGINPDASAKPAGNWLTDPEAFRQTAIGGAFAGAFEKSFKSISPQENLEKAATGLEKWFERGIFLIVGVIFLIIGLVMMSRPVREGIKEGVQEALSE